jgi:hypothetical protein
MRIDLALKFHKTSHHKRTACSPERQFSVSESTNRGACDDSHGDLDAVINSITL